MPKTPTNVRARSSSVQAGGGRRSSVQPVLPYRGENWQIGRKTGLAIEETNRDRHGYEDPENVIGRDVEKRKSMRRSSVGGKGKNRKLSIVEQDEIIVDHTQDMSEDMDLDSPLQPHPISSAYTISSRRSSGPNGSFSSDVPSPLPASTPRSRGAKSKLSQSQLVEDDDDENEPIDYDNDISYPQQDDFTHEPDDDEERTSFSQINQTPSPSPSPVIRRRELSAVPEDEEGEEEEEIAAGLDEVDLGPPEDDEIEQEEEGESPNVSVVASKGKGKGKGKGKDKAPPKKKTVKTRPRKRREELLDTEEIVRFMDEDGIIHEEIRDKEPTAGVRRSRRHHMKPLEWWRLERVVYARPEYPDSESDDELAHNDPLNPTGINRKHPRLAVPRIKEVIRYKPEDVIPLGVAGKKKRAERARSRSRSRSAKPSSTRTKIVYRERDEFPERGWDDDCDPIVPVLTYPENEGEEPEVVERRVAFPSNHFQPKAAMGNTWKFQKIFGDEEFIASGLLVIPPGKRKPSKGSKDNTYMFYIAEGAVNIALHESNRIIAQGGSFMVPRGNTYFIENICEREVKIFFTQARKVREGDEEEVKSE